MRKTLFVISILILVSGAFFLKRESYFSPAEVGYVATSTPEKTYTLAFVGDVMLSRGVGNKIKESGDPRYPFLKIAAELQKYDFLFGNLEGPMSDQGKNQGSIYSFRADPVSVAGLTYAGFKAMSIANNHIWDWGKDAMLDTRAILEKNSINAIGAGKDLEEAGKPFLTQVGSTTIGILAATNLYPKKLYAASGTSGVNNTDNIPAQIKALRPQVDILIVSAHWGEEYQAHANAIQQKLAREWVDAGADLVIGSHPHVVQEVEQYKGKHIAYSLGNFVFDQDFSAETQNGLMLLVKLKNGEIEDVIQRKVSISEGFQPSLE